MKAEDKYLLGVLWKFGTIKPGTNQFVFQSYDKYEQMEYIRKRLAPDKVIKVSTRKDPRSGTEKTLYKLNFTNADWADKVRKLQSSETEVAKSADKDFVRGLLETKATVMKNGKVNCFGISLSNEKETNIISIKIAETCDSSIANSNIEKSCSRLKYGIEDTKKIIKTFSQKNPKHWGEVLKKMNPDD